VQRLASASSWLPKYSGKNIIRGYRKHYGVDIRCAVNELSLLRVPLDEAYVQRLLDSLAGSESASQRRKQKKREIELLMSDQGEDAFPGYEELGFDVPFHELHLPSREPHPYFKGEDPWDAMCGIVWKDLEEELWEALLRIWRDDLDDYRIEVFGDDDEP